MDQCVIRRLRIACREAPAEVGCRSCGGASRCVAWHGYWRLDTPAGCVVWHTGDDAQLRAGIALRLIAFASSLDRIGPFATNVRDIAAVMQIIAGRDANDSTSTTAPVPNYQAEAEKPVKRLRIGIPKEYFGAGMDPEVRKKVEAGIEVLRRLGCEIRRNSHAAHGLCNRGLLHHRDRGGQF